jgi:hypothetical protein
METTSTRQQIRSLSSTKKWKQVNGSERDLTIILHMKKMDSGTTAGSAAAHLLNNQTPTSGDSNNNVENSEKSKSENSEPKSGRKAFYKLIFKSSGSNNSSSTNDSNNNSQQSSAPATSNSYTKVSMERASGSNLESKISQLSLDQRQLQPQQQQANSLPSDLTKR